MARYILVFSSVLFLSQVKSQIIRSPLSPHNRPFTETIIEAPRNYIEAPCAFADAPRNYIEAPRAYTDAPRNYIEAPRAYTEAPRNYIDVPDAINYISAPVTYMQPQPTLAETPCNAIAASNLPLIPHTVPSTTIITDCTPSVCQNLVNTINLMVVSSLLQDTIGGEQVALQFARPLLNDILYNSVFSGGISNPSLVTPNFIAPSSIAPNVITPNFLPQNVVSPNVYSPSLAPRVLASPISSPNAAASANPSVNNAALSSLLQLLGNPL